NSSAPFASGNTLTRVTVSFSPLNPATVIESPGPTGFTAVLGLTDAVAAVGLLTAAVVDAVLVVDAHRAIIRFPLQSNQTCATLPPRTATPTASTRIVTGATRDGGEPWRSPPSRPR